jgi:hypothetical protein
MDTTLKVSRISSQTGARPSWSLAVFAHNESGRIGAALQSIVQAAAGVDVEVWVLANGCTDSTSDEVRACATVLPHLWLAEIDVADKANAWNVYVHELITPERAAEIETYFFMDGDVTLERDALALLASSLEDVPTAKAAGGMPATGRDSGQLARSHGEKWNAGRQPLRLARQFRRRRPAEAGPRTHGHGVRRFGGVVAGRDAVRTNEDRSQRPTMYLLRERGILVQVDVAAAAGGLSAVPAAQMALRARRPTARDARKRPSGAGLPAMPAHVHDLYVNARCRRASAGWVLDTPLRLLAVLWIRSFRKRGLTF